MGVFLFFWPPWQIIDCPHFSNGVSCLTTAKLLLGVVLSAVSLVIIIFIMKCKFKIGNKRIKVSNLIKCI